jgi:ketosteroid isomerase-like protein
VASFVRSAQEQPANPLTEIQSVLRAQQDAWNSGDIDGFMNGYARSPSTLFVADDEVRRGWETVRERYRQKYSDRTKMGTLAFSDVEITPLSANAAVVLGRWRLTRANDKPHLPKTAGRLAYCSRSYKRGFAAEVIHFKRYTVKRIPL